MDTFNEMMRERQRMFDAMDVVIEDLKRINARLRIERATQESMTEARAQAMTLNFMARALEKYNG